jgi:hypothetical protein
LNQNPSLYNLHRGKSKLTKEKQEKKKRKEIEKE